MRGLQRYSAEGDVCSVSEFVHGKTWLLPRCGLPQVWGERGSVNDESKVIPEDQVLWTPQMVHDRLNSTARYLNLCDLKASAAEMDALADRILKMFRIPDEEIRRSGKTIRKLSDKLEVYRRSLKILGIKYKMFRGAAKEAETRLGLEGAKHKFDSAQIDGLKQRCGDLEEKLALSLGEAKRLGEIFNELAKAVGWTKDRWDQTGESPMQVARDVAYWRERWGKEVILCSERSTENWNRARAAEELLRAIKEHPHCNLTIKSVVSGEECLSKHAEGHRCCAAMVDAYFTGKAKAGAGEVNTWYKVSSISDAGKEIASQLRDYNPLERIAALELQLKDAEEALSRIEERGPKYRKDTEMMTHDSPLKKGALMAFEVTAAIARVYRKRKGKAEEGK